MFAGLVSPWSVRCSFDLVLGPEAEGSTRNVDSGKRRSQGRSVGGREANRVDSQCSKAFTREKDKIEKKPAPLMYGDSSVITTPIVYLINASQKSTSFHTFSHFDTKTERLNIESAFSKVNHSTKSIFLSFVTYTTTLSFLHLFTKKYFSKVLLKSFRNIKYHSSKA